jgi:hypothetical protein
MRRIRLGLLTAGALALLAAGSESARADDCDSLSQQYRKAMDEEGQFRDKAHAAEAVVKSIREDHQRLLQKVEDPSAQLYDNRNLEFATASLKYALYQLALAKADFDKAVERVAEINTAYGVLDCLGERLRRERKAREALDPTVQASQPADPDIPADMDKLIDAIGEGVREQLKKLRKDDRPEYDARIARLRRAANLPPLPPTPGGSSGTPGTASSPAADLEKLIDTLGPGSTPSVAGLPPGSAEEPPLVIPELPGDILDMLRKLRETDPPGADEMERRLREKIREEATERRRREAAEQQKQREANSKPAAPVAPPAVPPDQGYSVYNWSKDFIPGQKCPAGTRFEVCKYGAGVMHPGSTPIAAGAIVGCVEPRWETHFCRGSNPEVNCKCEQRGTDVPSRAELHALAPLPPIGLRAVAPSLLPPPVLPQPQIAAAPPAVLHTPPQPPPKHVVPVPPKQQKQARQPRPQQRVNQGQAQAQAQAAQDAQDAAAAIAVIGIIGGIAAGAAMSSGPTYSQPSGYHH